MAAAPTHRLTAHGPGRRPGGHRAAPSRPRRHGAHRRPSQRRRWAAALAALAGAGCVVAGVLLLAARPPAEVGEAPLAAPPVDAVSGLTDARRARGGEVSPLTALPGAVSRPAGVVPVALALPEHGITAPVVPVRTGPRGALVVPEPPSTVGWWAPSALAGGGTGPTVLAGHVDTARGGIGALAALRDVAVGAPVVLRGADGREVAYEVVARRRYAKAALPPEIFHAGGPPALVLVTCGGRFDPATRHYTDNVVVHAVPARA